MDFKSAYDRWAEMVNRAIDNYVAEKDTPEGSIYKAMRYSLTAGGKRLRPVLSLAVCDMLGGNAPEIMPFACAIEMIHTYSLIHDDLPAMDNDDYRRGKPTNHKVFGEAMAVLAGDALLNRAFEIMVDNCLGLCVKDIHYQKAARFKNSGKCCVNSKEMSPITLRLMAMDAIAEASGASGMIGGQVVDLESEGRLISPELLQYMHRCKTGALIKAAVMSSAILCGASEDEKSRLETYAEKIGLAFQIKDDILNVEGNPEEMGKATGSDAANKKSTFVSVFGLERSKSMLDDITAQAILSIDEFGKKAEFLKEIAIYIHNRNK